MREQHNVVKHYADSVMAHPVRWLLFYVALTVVAFVFGRPNINTDLANLLPDHAPAVQALDQAKARRGGGGEYFSIAIQSPDPVANARFMDALSEKIEQWPETRYVKLKRDKDFIREHALLFLPVTDLLRIKTNLQRLIREQQAKKNPLFVDLTKKDRKERDKDDPDWRDPATWIDPVTLKALGLSEEQVQELFPFHDEDTSANGAKERGASANDLPDKYRNYMLSPDGTVGIVLTSVTVSSTDVKASSGLYDRGTALIASLDPASYNPNMKAEVVGTFRNFLEVRSLMHDANHATVISLGVLIVLLLLMFRSPRIVLIVTAPLVMGIGWSLFLISLIYTELNTLTAFIFAMLVGMGIDYSIHIYQRLEDEFHSGKPWNEAIEVALTHVGRALLTAMATTVAALTIMGFSRFDGFRQFGIACAIGVLTCLAATVTVLPVMISVSERLRPMKRNPRRGTTRHVDADPVWAARRKWIFRGASIVVFGLAVAGAFLLPQVRFEYNFRNLSGPSTSGDIHYGSALGGTRSSAPAVILGDSQEQMRKVDAYLRKQVEEGDKRISGWVTVATFLPDNQDERMMVIDDIHDILDKRAVKKIGGHEGELIHTMLDLTNTDTFTRADLPDWIVSRLTEQDGSFGRMGLLYADVQWWNVLKVRQFEKKYGVIHLSDGEEVPIASTGFILDNVVRYVQGDADRLGLLALAAIIIILLINLRSIRASVLCLSTLFTGLLIAVVGLVIFDVKLGLYNVIVIPTVMGVGIDGAVHIWHRFLEEGKTNLWRIVRSTGFAVFASSATTIAGFLGLLFVEHKGIQTIGQLAIIGITANMIAVIGIMPGLLTFYKPDAIPDDTPPAPHAPTKPSAATRA